jgi:hypothetical protein
MVAMLARREIITYGAEAFFNRAGVIWGVRAGGLLSLFLALMKAHDLLDLGATELEKQMESMMQDRAVNNADDVEFQDGDGGIAGDMAAAATTMMSGDESANGAATPMKLRGSSNAAEEMADEAVGAPPQPNWWEVALEGMFKMTGNELALQGLRVSRGETLTEDEKMRIRELEQAQEATGGDVLQAPEAREEALSAHSETRAAQGGDHARAQLREEQEDDIPPALREGASSIVGADEGEEEANVAVDQGSRFDFGGGRGMKKEPPSVVNMLPAALRPFAWPILLLFSLFTLCKQVWRRTQIVTVTHSQARAFCDHTTDDEIIVISHARMKTLSCIFFLNANARHGFFFECKRTSRDSGCILRHKRAVDTCTHRHAWFRRLLA